MVIRSVNPMVLCALLVGSAVSSTGALAQSSTNDNTLAEVIVTAERISTRESKTPISMEVLGQNELASKGIMDFVTLSQQDPTLNFDTGNGGGFFTVRGISGAGGVGPAVPIAFDGFYYNLNYIFNNVLYDTNRVEVLRGPQGTLFGRNASGGLINVVSNEPTKVFGGYGDLTLGNFSEVNAEGALNLPVSDTVQFRVAFASAQHAAYRSLVFGGVAADDESATSGRAKLAMQPTEHLNLLLTFQATHVGGAGTADNIFVMPGDANFFPTHAAIPLTTYDTKVYNVAFASSVRLDDQLMQWRVVYDNLPFGMSVTYLGGYDALTYEHLTPLVSNDAVLLPPIPSNFPISSTAELSQTQNPRTQNEELRLTSASDQRLTWQAGVFYFRTHIGSDEQHFRDLATPSAPDIVAFPFNDNQWSTAAYGQASYHIGDVALSGGLRYTRDYVSREDKLSPGDGIIPALQSVKFSKTTWHLGADWNPTNRNLLYAKIDTGYRSGGFNVFVPPPPAVLSTIEPYNAEYVTAYEVGSKNRLLEDRASFNVDAFYMNYKGEQLSSSNGGGTFIVNAASTKIYGIEAQLVALWEPIARFDLNATFLHARFDSQVFTNALGQQYNIGGNELTQSPPISLTAGIEHSWPIKMGKLTVRGETKYQAGQYYDFYNFPDSHQPAFTNSTAHLRFDSADGHWSTDLFVRNIENSKVISDESESFSPPLIMPGAYNVGFQAPRTFGVRIHADF
jgi:iron complex outermembrane recepter protein